MKGRKSNSNICLPDCCLFFILIFFFLFSYNKLEAEDFFKVKGRIIETSWKKIGFFYLTPIFSVRNLGYSTNIYWQSSTDNNDWIADLGMEFNLSLIVKNRFIIQVSDLPYYSFYVKNKDKRSFNNIFKITLYTYLGNFNLKYVFEKPYIQRRPTNEFSWQVRQDNRFHTLSLDYGSYRAFFINLYVKQKEMRYKDESYLGEYDLVNTMSHKEYWAGVGLNKIIFTRTLLSLNYEYFEQKFDYLSERDRKGHQVSLGIKFPEISRIKGFFKYGIKLIKPENPEFEDFTTDFGIGNVSVNLFKRLKFNFSYLFDNFLSFYDINSTYNNRTLSAGFEYYISSKFKFGYKYNLYILSYKNSTSENQSRQDEFNSSIFSIGIKLFKKMGIGVMYTNYWGDSTLSGYDRRYKFIGGYIIHEF